MVSFPGQGDLNMSRTAKFLIVLGGLALFGLARWPLESAVTASFKERHLLPPDVGIELRERLGQNSYAAVLGGARSLIASVQNLIAFTAWENKDWGAVESHYRLITDLQPRVPSYWELYSWHMGYNAAGYYRYNWQGPPGADPDATEALRRDLWERYVRKAHEVLDDATRNNPDDWRLLELAGRLHADMNKIPDHRKAAEYYGRAAAIDGAPDMIRRFEGYELSMLPDRRAEAMEKLGQLFHSNPRNRVPTLVATLFELQLETGVPPGQWVPMEEFGDTPQRILEELTLHAESRIARGILPGKRMIQIIRGMENDLAVPPEQRLQLPQFAEMGISPEP